MVPLATTKAASGSTDLWSMLWALLVKSTYTSWEILQSKPKERESKKNCFSEHTFCLLSHAGFRFRHLPQMHKGRFSSVVHCSKDFTNAHRQQLHKKCNYKYGLTYWVTNTDHLTQSRSCTLLYSVNLMKQTGKITLQFPQSNSNTGKKAPELQLDQSKTMRCFIVEETCAQRQLSSQC